RVFLGGRLTVRALRGLRLLDRGLVGRGHLRLLRALPGRVLRDHIPRGHVVLGRVALGRSLLRRGSRLRRRGLGGGLLRRAPPGPGRLPGGGLRRGGVLGARRAGGRRPGGGGRVRRGNRLRGPLGAGRGSVAPTQAGRAPRLVRAVPGRPHRRHVGEVPGHAERQPTADLAGTGRLLLGRPPGLVLLRGPRRHTRSFTVLSDHHQIAPRRSLYGHPRERRPMGPRERSITSRAAYPIFRLYRAFVGITADMHDRCPGGRCAVHLGGDPDTLRLHADTRRHDDLHARLVGEHPHPRDLRLQFGGAQVEQPRPLVHDRGETLGHPPAPGAGDRVLVGDLEPPRRRGALRARPAGAGQVGGHGPELDVGAGRQGAV